MPALRAPQTGLYAPTVLLETARLRVRPLEADDWRPIHAYLSDPAVRLFVPEWPETEEQTREFVQENLEDPRQHALVLRDDDRLIGHVGFWKWFGARTYEGDRRGARGPRTRLRDSCTPPCHRDLQPLEHGVGSRDGEGRHAREAHFRRAHLQPDGTWTDEYFYALLAEEWPTS